MTDHPLTILRSQVAAVDRELFLMGLLMLSVGILVGVNLVARPAAAQHYSPVLGYVELPRYLEVAAWVSKASAAAATISLGGLLYLDYTHE